MKNVIVLIACIVGFNFLSQGEPEKKEVKVINCKVIDSYSIKTQCK